MPDLAGHDNWPSTTTLRHGQFSFTFSSTVVVAAARTIGHHGQLSLMDSYRRVLQGTITLHVHICTIDCSV